MQTFEPLSAFYQAIADDPRIGVTHISLYLALLNEWQLGGGKTQLEVTRRELMRRAKINARQTYHKCIHQLQEYGYIRYWPGSNSIDLTQVELNRLV